VFSVTQPAVSKHWRKHKALTLTIGFTSSFLHLPPNSFGRGVDPPIQMPYVVK